MFRAGWTIAGDGANLGTRARYPSGKGEVCKTFIRRFDSDPRLHSKDPVNTAHFLEWPKRGCRRRKIGVRLCRPLRPSVAKMDSRKGAPGSQESMFPQLKLLNCRRNCDFSNFPVEVCGNSARKTKLSGSCHLANRSPRKVRSSSWET